MLRAAWSRQFRLPSNHLFENIGAEPLCGVRSWELFAMKIVKMGATQAVFGWPLFSTWNGLVYARDRQGWLVRIKTFLGFLPLLSITTAVWMAFWGMVVWPFTRIGL
jgi:hypothetical protein